MERSVSIIIPAYNSREYIGKAIESATSQSFKNIEIFVVDDGSTDGTKDAVESYIRDSKIRYIHQENKGPAAARNLGISKSSGEFIAFLDADDIWLPDKLEQQMPLFDDPEVALVFSDTEIFGDGFPFKKHSEFSRFARGDVYAKLIMGNFIPTSSVVVRRVAMDEAGGFDEDKKISIGEDYFLWLMIARKYKFDFSPESLVKYRIHGGQTSASRIKSYKSLCHIYAKLGKRNGYTFGIVSKYLENKMKFLFASMFRE